MAAARAEEPRHRLKAGQADGDLMGGERRSWTLRFGGDATHAHLQVEAKVRGDLEEEMNKAVLAEVEQARARMPRAQGANHAVGAGTALMVKHHESLLDRRAPNAAPS